MTLDLTSLDEMSSLGTIIGISKWPHKEGNVWFSIQVTFNEVKGWKLKRLGDILSSTLMHSAITEQHHFDRSNFIYAGGSFIASYDFFFIMFTMRKCFLTLNGNFGTALALFGERGGFFASAFCFRLHFHTRFIKSDGTRKPFVLLPADAQQPSSINLVTRPGNPQLLHNPYLSMHIHRSWCSIWGSQIAPLCACIPQSILKLANKEGQDSPIVMVPQRCLPN